MSQENSSVLVRRFQQVVRGTLSALVLLSIPVYAIADTFSYTWTQIPTSMGPLAGWTFNASDNVITITPPSSFHMDVNFTFVATVTNNSGSSALLGGGLAGGALFSGLGEFHLGGNTNLQITVGTNTMPPPPGFNNIVNLTGPSNQFTANGTGNGQPSDSIANAAVTPVSVPTTGTQIQINFHFTDAGPMNSNSTSALPATLTFTP